MNGIFIGIVIFLFVLAIFDLIVGVSNDAVNFLNSAIGARTASFKKVMIISAIGVFFGASMSNGMMDIARHGIFQPEYFYFKEIMIILLAVMVTDVILLDIFNSLGMPTSTTVSLVFELLGGTVAIAVIKNITTDGALTFAQMINTEKALSVILGIFLSIAIAFFFGALIQYISRLIFSFNYKRNLKWFAGVFGGIAVTAIVYFMLIKGFKDATFMKADTKLWVKENTTLIILSCFAFFAVLMQILHWCRVNVFKVIVLIGTFSLAMAFAGNDLVNFIGVPLAGLSAFQDYAANSGGVAPDNYLMSSLTESAHTPMYFLIAAGAIMVIALYTSKKAKNVIKTSVNLSRQDDGDEMFGSSSIARKLTHSFISTANFIVKSTPLPVRNWVGSRFNKDEAILENEAAFDQLRAAVNLVVAALLVALGTSMKLPLSTTFVTFMVAMGSSLADRAWSRESAVFRVTGVISVIGGWFITAGAAFILCALVALTMYYGGVVAMLIMCALVVFFLLKSSVLFKKKNNADKEDKVMLEILNSNDKIKVWDLLRGHITNTAIGELHNVAEYYNKFTESFINDDHRGLNKVFSSLSEQKLRYKKLRRQELIGLKRVDDITAIQAATWFHLTTNATFQLIYSMIRMSDPSKEHMDNNFKLLPEDCVNEFIPLRDELVQLLKDYSIQSNQSDFIRRISQFKKKVSSTMEMHISRVHRENDSSNLNIYIIYQTMLQESYQTADNLKHFIRAINGLNGI